MKFAKTLNRDEMKSIMAGNTNCVICSNDSSTELVYVDYNGNDPTTECRRHGPYGSGSWGECPARFEEY